MNNPSCLKMPACIMIPNANSTRFEPAIPDQDINQSDLISIANEKFGERQWSHSITNQTLDFVEYVNGKYHVGCSSLVKVQLSDGTFHEAMGYSNSNGSIKGPTIFSARLASVNSALKSSLLYFGEDIATKITKLIKEKSNDVSQTISVIGEPQKIPIVKTQIIPPIAQSTPKPAARTTPIVPSHVLEPVDKGEPSDNVEKLKKSPNVSPGVIREVDKAQVVKTALTEEEKRAERKRRQAQKQEEYKKLLKKEMMPTTNQNPKF